MGRWWLSGANERRKGVENGPGVVGPHSVALKKPGGVRVDRRPPLFISACGP